MLSAYDASRFSLATKDMGSFILSIVELRCVDVGSDLSSFLRVSSMCMQRDCQVTIRIQTYWMEAVSLRMLTPQDLLDEGLLETIIDHWRLMN